MAIVLTRVPVRHNYPMDHIQKPNVFAAVPRLSGAGFSLLELAIVLVIISFLFTIFLATGSGFLLGKTVEADRAKLRAIETAIAGFVSVNGRLPCPADGSLNITVASAGIEIRDASGDCTGSMVDQTRGVVPWTTIAISEADASDNYNQRIMYRVAYGLTRNAAMDFTACDPAGTGAPTTSADTLSCSGACTRVCSTACASNSMSLCTHPSSVLPPGRGILVRNGLVSDVTSVVLMDPSATPTQGAAYVLIAHGKNGAGAYLSGSGVLSAVSGGTREAQNANNQVMAAWYAIDTDYNDSAGSINYDDLVLRPSIMKVVLQAQRGPRAH